MVAALASLHMDDFSHGFKRIFGWGFLQIKCLNRSSFVKNVDWNDWVGRCSLLKFSEKVVPPCPTAQWWEVGRPGTAWWCDWAAASRRVGWPGTPWYPSLRAPGEGSRPGTPCQPKSDTVRNRISSPILSSNFTKFWNDSLFIFIFREFLCDELFLDKKIRNLNLVFS